MPTAATSIEGTMHEIGTHTYVSRGETRENEEVFPVNLDQQKMNRVFSILGHVMTHLCYSAEKSISFHTTVL